MRITGIFQDISKRVENENSKLQAKHELVEISRSIPGIIFQFRFNKDGTFDMLLLSLASKQVLGFETKKMQDTRFLFSRIYPDDYSGLMLSIKEANYEGAIWDYEFRVYDATNAVVWIKGQSRASLDNEGNILHHRVLLDITKQKSAEYDFLIANVSITASPTTYQALY